MVGWPSEQHKEGRAAQRRVADWRPKGAIPKAAIAPVAMKHLVVPVTGATAAHCTAGAPPLQLGKPTNLRRLGLRACGARATSFRCECEASSCATMLFADDHIPEIIACVHRFRRKADSGARPLAEGYKESLARRESAVSCAASRALRRFDGCMRLTA